MGIKKENTMGVTVTDEKTLKKVSKTIDAVENAGDDVWIGVKG